MNIYLVRHGNYSNPENIFAFNLPVVLSEDGTGQIKRVGEWFSQQSIHNLPIYTSPIKRCTQTAEIISEATHSQVTIDERLIESGCPNLQGKKQPEKDPWKLECSDPSREPVEEVQKRMLSIFDEKVREGKNCILVSHGDPITSLYYHLMKMPLVPCLFDDEHLDVYIKRAEIVKVVIEIGGSYQVTRFTV